MDDDLRRRVNWSCIHLKTLQNNDRGTIYGPWLQDLIELLPIMADEIESLRKKLHAEREVGFWVGRSCGGSRGEIDDALATLAQEERAMPDPDRWSRRFAYLPAQMSDGRWIWWQTYFTRTSRQPINGGPGILIRPTIQKVARIPEPRSIPLPRPPKK